MFSEGTGPYQTVPVSADEPVEALQAIAPSEAAEPPAAEERLGRELTPLVDYGDIDSPLPRSRSQSLAPAEAVEPSTGDRVTVADLASEMDTIRSQIQRMEDLVRAQLPLLSGQRPQCRLPLQWPLLLQTARARHRSR